jgi:hypothetical protein
MVLIGLSSAILSATGQSQKRKTGDEIAQELIGIAKQHNGEVDLTKLTDTVCLVAESLSAEGFALRRFPEFKIAKDEYSDKSNGVWSILLAFKASATVEIYAMDQRVLSWRVPEDTRISEATVCPRRININVRADVPKVNLISIGTVQ